MPDWLRILGEALTWSLGQKETYIWWAAIQLVGLVAFPLTFAFFQRLPDRGYTFTKPLGLALLGYILWMGATVGLLPDGPVLWGRPLTTRAHGVYIVELAQPLPAVAPSRGDQVGEQRAGLLRGRERAPPPIPEDDQLSETLVRELRDLTPDVR